MRRAHAQQTAYARIRGGPDYPGIRGLMTLRDVRGGTEIHVSVTGLPEFSRRADKAIGPHGFHIHMTGDCYPGVLGEPFPRTGGHYNPDNQPHGNHAGDFPVLFSNHGTANMSFFTDRFSVADVVGRSVVIHESPDDYRTEPAGDSGRKIACGVIVGG